MAVRRFIRNKRLNPERHNWVGLELIISVYNVANFRGQFEPVAAPQCNAMHNWKCRTEDQQAQVAVGTKWSRGGWLECVYCDDL